MEKKVIVIGMDNAGKTTLVNELAEKTGYKILHSLGKAASKEEMSEFVTGNLQSDENVIFERFSPIEEMVYGKILRNEEKFTWKDPVFSTLKNTDSVIIYCRPSEKDIMNFGDREQDEGIKENAEKLLKRFDFVARKLKKKGFKVTKYNWKKDHDKVESLSL